MRINLKYNNSPYSNQHFVYSLKDDAWLEDQRYAGKVLVECLSIVSNNLKPGKSTKDLDTIAKEFILSKNCSCTFNGYRGFPGNICTSVNKELVHGIPSESKILQAGDFIKIDVGTTYNGAIADAAHTYFVSDGQMEIPSKYAALISACKKSLMAAIENIKINITTLGDIGYCIRREAARIGANVIVEFGGHGLEKNFLHGSPFIYNYGELGDGPKIRPGMTLAIEPMMVYGNVKTSFDNDGWTVLTEDISVHEEHTIFVHENKIEIITI